MLSRSSYGWLSGLPQNSRPLSVRIASHFDSERLVEGQDTVVEQVAGGDGKLGGVDLGEGQGAKDIDHNCEPGRWAAFDFLTERVRQATRWMQASGLEWAYTPYREPRRLWG